MKTLCPAGLIATLAAGNAAAQALLSPMDALIARAKSFELDTPYVPPPGDPLEHHRRVCEDHVLGGVHDGAHQSFNFATLAASQFTGRCLPAALFHVSVPG
jgi:hypothetical protein